LGTFSSETGDGAFVDLVGKHGRVRTIPMPTWVKAAIDACTSAAGVAEGCIFRPVSLGDTVSGEGMSEKVIWQILRPYVQAAGVLGIAPHDCRRNCAKLCQAAGGELEQIQLLLGHASIKTTDTLPRHKAGFGSRVQ
jgi:site-specific recombinase XerD